MDATTWYLILMALFLFVLLVIDQMFKARKSNKQYPPSPPGLPVIGHLHHLASFVENPWEGFNLIRSKFGDIVGLQLGSRKCVMVSTPELMREVLLAKGDIFCDRPDFKRYHLIFNGDRENSLALCNWTKLQQMRRIVATIGILPRFGSSLYNYLDKCIQNEFAILVPHLDSSSRINKTDVLFSCSNIFTSYLCSKRFERHESGLMETLYNYDYIFYDINNCGPVDFMPWVTYFGYGKSYLNNIIKICASVRDFMEGKVIKPRLDQFMMSSSLDKKQDAKDLKIEKDFLDMSLNHHIMNPVEYPWEVSVFEVMDLIGGHSAVGNLLMRLLGWISLNPKAQERIFQEAKDALAADCGVHNFISLNQKNKMPFTESCILETLRLASSPIVPHVANKATTLSGYEIKAGTMILFNSYHLNMSSEYWNEPGKFSPERFLVPIIEIPLKEQKTSDTNDNFQIEQGLIIKSNLIAKDQVTQEEKEGEEDQDEVTGNEIEQEEQSEKQKDQKYQILKPDHFFPFSFGRRACLGYKLVTLISFSILSNLCSRYMIEPQDEQQVIEQLKPKGSLALDPRNCFTLKLKPRNLD